MLPTGRGYHSESFPAEKPDQEPIPVGPRKTKEQAFATQKSPPNHSTAILGGNLFKRTFPHIGGLFQPGKNCKNSRCGARAADNPETHLAPPNVHCNLHFKLQLQLYHQSPHLSTQIAFKLQIATK